MTKPVKIKETLLGEGMPKICVPITAPREEALEKEARAAKEAGAQLVEWRADFYENLGNREKMEETLAHLSRILGEIPLLFTIRTKKEGGNAHLSTEEYVTYNLWAAQSQKADLVDVEVFGDEERKEGLIAMVQEAGAKVIASSHDFEKTEEEALLLRRFQAMDATGADILKLAVMPRDFSDTAALMRATWKMTKRTSRPLVSMSMGSIGAISRIGGESFGSCITFGTVGAASAPGQFPIGELGMMLKTLHRKDQGK